MRPSLSTRLHNYPLTGDRGRGILGYRWGEAAPQTIKRGMDMQTFDMVINEEQVALLRTVLDSVEGGICGFRQIEIQGMDSMLRDLEPDVLNDLTK